MLNKHNITRLMYIEMENVNINLRKAKTQCRHQQGLASTIVQSALFCVQSVRHSRVVHRVGWTVARPSGPPPQTAAPEHPPASHPPRAASRTSPRPANTIPLKQLLQCHPLQTLFCNTIHLKQSLQHHPPQTFATSSGSNSCCNIIHFKQLLQHDPLYAVAATLSTYNSCATSSISNSRATSPISNSCCNIIHFKQLLQHHPRQTVVATSSI